MEQQPPIFMDGTTSPAEDARRMMQAIMGPGIARIGDLVVTQNGTPNMSVNVAGGGAFIAGSSTDFQGTYFVENRGAKNLPLAASHPSNPRIDLVVARVREDLYDSGTFDDWVLEVVTGTPSSVPVAPAVPASSLPLAQIVVSNGTSAIIDANVTSLRQLARPWNSAWGQIGYAERRTNSAAFTTLTYPLTDIVIPVYAGRRIGVSLFALFTQTSSGSSVQTAFIMQDGSQRTATSHLSVNNGQATSHVVSQFPQEVETTEVRTYALAVSAGANTVISAANNRPTYLAVHDMGPIES